MRRSYPVSIVESDGDFVVSARDLPEVVTSGDSVEEASMLAVDAVVVAVRGRLADDSALPTPSKALPGETLVALPAALAAKAAIHEAWMRAGITKSELARRMGKTETEARRILDPRHGTKLETLDEAAQALGFRLVIDIVEA